jgi:5,10-methylene-tetrahydrofolate dehydrogenase/methenyl tetrahydrofolate cyclohydrolase
MKNGQELYQQWEEIYAQRLRRRATSSRALRREMEQIRLELEQEKTQLNAGYKAMSGWRKDEEFWQQTMAPLRLKEQAAKAAGAALIQELAAQGKIHGGLRDLPVSLDIKTGHILTRAARWLKDALGYTLTAAFIIGLLLYLFTELDLVQLVISTVLLAPAVGLFLAWRRHTRM